MQFWQCMEQSIQYHGVKMSGMQLQMHYNTLHPSSSHRLFLLAL